MKQLVGQWQFVNGQPVSGGRVFFKLSNDAVALGSNQVAPSLVAFTLDNNGSIPVNSQLWANDELSPSGTTYTVSVLAPGGGLIWGAENFSIAGSSPINLNNLSATLSGGVVFSGAVLLNPTAIQTITGFGLTLTGSAPLTVNTETVSSLNTIVYLDGVTYPQTIAGFNSAIAAACNGTTPGTLVVPPGLTITGPPPNAIPSNCYVVGYGSTLKEQSGTNASSFLFTGTGATNITIEGLTIDGNSSNNTGAGQNIGFIHFDAATNVKLDKVKVQNFYGNTGGTAPCVFFGGAGSNISVTNSTISNCGASGHAADGIYASGTTIRIQNNTVSSASDTAVVCEAFTDCVVTGNLITSSGNGVGISGLITSTPSSGAVVTGNDISGGSSTTGGEIVVANAVPGTMKQVTISGNTIHDSTSGAGIYVYKTTGITIGNNTIYNISPSSTNQPHCIAILDSSDASIIGNDIDLCGQYGILAEGLGSFLISGNHVSYASQQSSGTYHGIFVTDGTLSVNTTIVAGVASTGSQTVTPVAMTNITVGIPLKIDSGATVEYVYPTAVTATTFTAVFNQTHAANVTVVEASSNSGHITGNSSFGFTQGRGLVIAGASDRILVEDNDLRWNNNNPGYSNTASGTITNWLNKTNNTTGANETINGPISLTSGALILDNAQYYEALTSGGANVALFGLTNDATNITRFRAGVDAGGFQWSNQAANTQWMALTGSLLTVNVPEAIGSGASITSSGGGGTVVGQVAATLQKSESGADTNVLTYTPPAVAGSYRLRFTMVPSATNTATLGWTATWKDANGTSQSPTNLILFATGSSSSALTVTGVTNQPYYSEINIDVDNSATNIVIKLTFTGTSFTAKVTASIERIV